MKIFWLVIVMVLFSINFAKTDDKTKFNQLNKEEDSEFHRQRREWLENMHRTEPGVNYKILKNELLHYKMNLMNESRKKLDFDSPNLQKYVSNNGKVAGYWKERGSKNQAGRIHTADVDLIDGIIYAASSGGNVWKGNMKGEYWTCINNSAQFSIQNIKVEKVNGKRRIFVFDNTYVYLSDNEGLSWETSSGLENVTKWGNIMRGIVINDNNALKIYVLINEWDYTNWKQIRSVYYSEDNGISFKQVLAVNNTNNIDIWGLEKSIGEYTDPAYPNPYNKLIYVHQDSVFSIEGTTPTFLNKCDDIKLLKPNDIHISANQIKDKVYLYINVRENNGTLNIFKTTDFGSNLLFMNQSPTSYFMSNSFGVSKINPDIAMIGGVECYKTTDGGEIWNAINTWGAYYGDPLKKLHADIPGIESFRTAQDKEFFFICTDGGLYKTKDDYSVENISLSGLNVSQYYSIYTYYDQLDEIVYAGSQDQGFQRSETFMDKQLSFTQTISGDYGSLTSGDGGKTLWTVYPGFAMVYPDAPKSTKSGSWEFTGSGNDRVWMPPIVAVPGEPYTAYCAPGAATNGSQVVILTYTLMDNNISVFELPYKFDAQDNENDVSALAVSALDRIYIYAATKKGKFYSSTDAGFSWTVAPEFVGPGYNYLHGACIFASKINKGTVYVTGSGYSNPAIFKSTDNGATFDSITGLPPCFVYQIDFTPDEEVMFAATNMGPYIYIKNHNRWYDIAGPDAPYQDYWSVNYLPWKKTARFATYGRGIWDFEIENLVTGVEDNNNVEINDLSVFPNPVTETINIKFNAPIGDNAVVKIVDLDGKLIHNCFDGIVSNEENNLIINLSNIKNISSGSYIVMLINKGMLKYQKINIVK